MKEHITSYILKRLSRAASEDDLIYSVCQKTGLMWEDGQALVEQVKNEHLTEIEAKQTPLRSLISLQWVSSLLSAFGIFYLWLLSANSRTCQYPQGAIAIR